MQTALRRKRGSAAVFVIVAIVVLGLAVTLYFNRQYQSRRRMIAYEREKAELARQESEAKTARAAAEKAEAEEAAAREKAEAEESAKKAAAAKAAAERAKAEKAKQLRFEDAEQAFIGAEVKMWTKGDAAAGESAWCMLPQKDGTGRFFEIVPARGDAPRQVCALSAEGTVEVMSPEIFATRNLDGDASWFVLRGGKALLRTNRKSLPPEGVDEKIAVPEEGQSYDIAEKMYGDAAKAVRVYRMRPPPVKWHVAFVTKGGRTLPAGKVAFGEKVTRELFRPAVKQALEEAAAKMTRAAASARAGAAAGAAAVPSSFTPSKKRTHFLYDKGKIKRTVDGLVYVPRVFKTARKEFSRNERQRQQDEERAAQHRAEWQALYDEALRQEKAEAAERAAWERARSRGTAKPRPQQHQQKVVVTPAHVERALDEGAFIYSPADE